ncbi:hypothetical protein [Brucella anthropi]|uniref:hypothetical protein n=1 Tax=Brucella anthropi TaxID=529 RepID=UPI0005BCC1D2|nr:hypothetical protein [Brucella anthropi]KIU69428.1 hypothetical protein TR92_06025 [Brucella anthropi]
MKEVDPRKARQGLNGRRILMILISSLILAVIVWGAVEFYGKMRPGRSFMDDNSKPPASTESQTPPSATGRQ